MNPRCGVNDDACNPNPKVARGWCMTHYARWKKWGDPLFVSRDPQVRFWAKVDKTSTCWLWRGAISDTGYGAFNLGSGRYASAHVTSYRWAVGPVDTGMQVDHLCGVRSCVNPAHLEQVAPLENARRAMRIGHGFRAPTTCHRGHDWSVHPPYIANRSDGRQTRRCRVCQNERDRDRRRATTANHFAQEATP